MPAPLYFADNRLPPATRTSIIANSAVLVPTFNDPNDRVALGTLAELFPDAPSSVCTRWTCLGPRHVHCLTQQQPA